MDTARRFSHDEARRRWVEAALLGRLGTMDYLAPDLPAIVAPVDRNSSAASGTRTPVSISGEISPDTNPEKSHKPQA
mgnify:CR=1 FL=1